VMTGTSALNGPASDRTAPISRAVIEETSWLRPPSVANEAPPSAPIANDGDRQ
jgi:hypothetical protein